MKEKNNPSTSSQSRKCEKLLCHTHHVNDCGVVVGARFILFLFSVPNNVWQLKSYTLPSGRQLNEIFCAGTLQAIMKNKQKSSEAYNGLPYIRHGQKAFVVVSCVCSYSILEKLYSEAGKRQQHACSRHAGWLAFIQLPAACSWRLLGR